MQKYNGRLKQIIVLRTDLKMRRGKEVSQGSHASLGGYIAHRFNPFVRMWMLGQFTKITVGIGSEEELLELHRQARELNLPCCLIQDAGKTEFNGVPTFTAVSIGPGLPEDVASLTSHLKLR